MIHLGEQNVMGAAGNLQGMLAGNPFGQQFVIQQRGIRGMTPNGSVPTGNAGAVAMLNQGMYAGPQYGQQLPSNIVKTVY